MTIDEVEAFIPTSCDFLVVGGGAAGLSVAYNLARRDAGSVVLLDRRAFGTGASNKSGGGMRRMFGERVGTQTVLRSFDVMKDLEIDSASGSLLREIGYLYLLGGTEQEAEASRILAHVDALAPGTASLLSRENTAAEFPWINTAGISSSVWSPRDGFVEPMELVGALVRAARGHGAQLFQGVRVEALEASAGKVVCVRTSAGTVRADRVILAASAGSRDLAKTAGIDLPLELGSSQRFLVQEVPQVERPYPFTFSLVDGFAFRSDGPGVMIGFGGGGQVFTGGGSAVDWDEARTNWNRAANRVPNLAAQKITGGVVGTLDRTPDAYPLIGFDADVTNLFCCCGFWGSGVMQSLGAGDAASELITTGGCSSVDIDLLDANRFRRGNPRPAHPFF